MNRRIKFRVWFSKAKAWIHGPHEEPSLDGINILGENILLGNFLNEVSIEDLNDVEVVQYTGREDKNGKGIFEGDILKIHNLDCTTGKDLSWCGKVYYDEGHAQFRIKSDLSSYTLSGSETYHEVVGNIFEHPDLIK